MHIFETPKLIVAIATKMRVNQYKLASYIIFISPCTNLNCKLGRFYL